MGDEGLVLDVSGTNVSVTLSLADSDGLLLQYEVTGASTLSEYQQVGGRSLWAEFVGGVCGQSLWEEFVDGVLVYK